MATIAGRTYNFDSSVLIGGATVRVIDVTDGSVAASGTSDEGTAEYSLTVSAGRYAVLAFKDDHHKTGVMGPIDVT